jgi:hypothetical protein
MPRRVFSGMPREMVQVPSYFSGNMAHPLRVASEIVDGTLPGLREQLVILARRKNGALGASEVMSRPIAAMCQWPREF